MIQTQIDTPKHRAWALLDRNVEALSQLSDAIFYFGEVGMQEHRSAALLSDLLEEQGFAVQRGISGFPTAFCATFGQGEPVIAIHTEYDAAASNSQRGGVVVKEEIVPGAPGHCEGHNVNAAVMVAAALAVKQAMVECALAGTLKIIGAPAEEQLLSRPYFVRDGLFDDVTLAIHNHIYDRLSTEYGVLQSALVSAVFNFQGEAAHAALSPWKGRGALDAVVLMDMGMAQYREHFQPGMSAQRTITHGGDQPNVISAKASVWWYFRHGSADGARTLFEQAQRIARGAALMANCEVEVDVQAAVWPVRCNQKLAELIQANVEAVGMPEWSAAEQDFARAIQAEAGGKSVGLETAARPLLGPGVQLMASNDSGDISWVAPMGRVYFPSNIPGVTYHHWTAGAALTTSIAHKGALAGAKVLAGSVIDALIDAEAVAEIRRTFKAEIGDQAYRPLLPPEQTPPQELNRAVMEAHRAAMEPHYAKARPTFQMA